MRRPLGILSALPLLLLAPHALAQNDSAKPKAGEATVAIRQEDQSKFPDITLEFEVKGADDTPILDAARDEFRVLEYDAPVAITAFSSPVSREFRPTTVVLVLDRSGSMLKQNRIGGLKRAVSAFLESMPKGSRVAVIAFSDDVDLICPFTDDPGRVRESLGDLVPDGQTRYYDAVVAAVRLLAKEPGRRAILAMTDGDDTASEEFDLDSAAKAAQLAGLPIHTLALGSRQETRPDDLRRLAERTRGQAFSSRDPEGLRNIFEEVARRLGQTYTLTYRTERPLQDGTLRPIKVLYAKSTHAAESAVYIPGMVVPAAGWSWLFLGLVGGLAVLIALPSVLRKGS